MQEARESNNIWALYSGTLLLVIIVAVVVWSEYKDWHLGIWIAVCAGGSLYWFIGFALAGTDALARTQPKYEFGGITEGSSLRAFYLNGHYFQPYEQDTSDGRKQFRLLSSRAMAPECEAPHMRYLINEGLSDKMWPQISRRIEEEANWVFSA